MFYTLFHSFLDKNLNKFYKTEQVLYDLTDLGTGGSDSSSASLVGCLVPTWFGSLVTRTASFLRSSYQMDWVSTISFNTWFCENITKGLVIFYEIAYVLPNMIFCCGKRITVLLFLLEVYWSVRFLWSWFIVVGRAIAAPYPCSTWFYEIFSILDVEYMTFTSETDLKYKNGQLSVSHILSQAFGW